MNKIEKIFLENGLKDENGDLQYKIHTLGIALLLKRNKIKDIKLENYEEILSKCKPEYFWISMKRLFFENISIEKKEIQTMIFLASKLIDCTEKEIINEILNKRDIETISSNNLVKLINEIVDIPEKSRVADTFGRTGEFSAYLKQNQDITIDLYEFNPICLIEAIIRLYAINKSCNIINNFPGTLSLNKFPGDLNKIKYDFVFANPELDIQFFGQKLADGGYSTQYEGAKILINENNIKPYDITEEISPFLFLSLILISMLNEKGKAIVMVPGNCLSNNSNKLFRKYLTENYLSEIIKLPDNISPFMPLLTDDEEVYMVILEKEKKNESIKFSNLEYSYIPRGDINDIDIEKAVRQYKNNYKMISMEEIIKNDYSLDADLYIKNIQVENPVELEDVITDIFRGYQIGLKELKEMKVSNGKNINYRILKFKDNSGVEVTEINTKGKNLDRYLLKGGDIVINARGEKNTVIILPKSIEEDNFIANGSLIVIRVKEELMNSRYLELFLESEKGDIALDNIKSNNALYVGNLKKLQVPCPTLKEQEDILEKIRNLTKQIDDIKNLM